MYGRSYHCGGRFLAALGMTKWDGFIASLLGGAGANFRPQIDRRARRLLTSTRVIMAGAKQDQRTEQGRGNSARRYRVPDPARQSDRVGAEVLDLPLSVRDRLLRDGIYGAGGNALRYRPVRRIAAALHAAPGGPADGSRDGVDSAGTHSAARLRSNGGAEVGDGVRRMRVDRRFLRQLRHAAGNRSDRSGRCLRARMPAASRRRARCADGVAAQDSGPEAEARRAQEKSIRPRIGAR